MKVDITNEQMNRLVDEVVRQVQAQLGTAPSPAAAAPRPAAAPALPYPPSGFASVDDAVKAAHEAYRALKRSSLQDRHAMVQAMREVAAREAERLAPLIVAETGLGRPTDKVQKMLLAGRKTPGIEDLVPTAVTGDDGLTLVEPAPYGVVGAITPCTNPTSTIINNTISIVAAGNAVVFNPHPTAKRCSNEMVRLLDEAIVSAGGPRHLVTAVTEPTMDTGAALMKHPTIRLLIVTGGGIVVKLAMESGKRTIAAGPGNPPVIVDDTADLSHAARCIVDGASFDNNVLCIAEKEIFVFRTVADRLKEEMSRCGAYEVKGRESEALVAKVLDAHDPKHVVPCRDFVGKDASVLLEAVGIRPPPGVRLVMIEVKDLHHPLIQTEQLMPFIPILRVEDLDEALACALQAEHGFRHTAQMHSENVMRMSRVAREIETTIFVKNAPSYAGLGFGGEGHTTLSIAGPTGEGLTSARTFTRQRRCVVAGSFRII
jgi:propionaldehyde dehydrogenase